MVTENKNPFQGAKSISKTTKKKRKLASDDTVGTSADERESKDMNSPLADVEKIKPESTTIV